MIVITRKLQNLDISYYTSIIFLWKVYPKGWTFLIYKKLPHWYNVRAWSPLGWYKRGIYLVKNVLYIIKSLLKSNIYFDFFLDSDFFFFLTFFFGCGGIYCLSFSFSHSQIVIQYSKKKGYITILSANEWSTIHSAHSHINHIPNHIRE
jgi:hypothetical protein